MSTILHELEPIALAPFCKEDTDPGTLKTGEHDGNFFLSFEGEQHFTELNSDQIADLAEQSGEPASELEGFGYNPQFNLSPKSALALYERLGDFLSKLG